MQTIENSLSHIQRIVLPNGIVLLVTENPIADIIATRIFVRAGSCYENRDLAGLVHLLSAVMTKGCDGLSSWEIAETVESVGASLSADASTDYFLLAFKTVTSDFTEILTLAAKLLRSPTFPEDEVELERRLALQDIRSQKEQPFTIAFDQMRQAMYPNHPYSMSVLGNETTMNRITRDDLVNYHQTYFRPDNLVISIAGRITVSDALTWVKTVFGDWEIPSNSPPVLDLPSIPIAPQVCLKPISTQQSIVMLGYMVYQSILLIMLP